ncbi:RELT-like protein 1 [Coregonus clupeaformis]|uniref:RELT-like protein 1 n=1 Tax=Coregonus suidteri TaxID=861788 RepID=A0AAN8MFL6_9TELE|nr:RELT-like protein 1 [Coregonus clupeaformis]XP_045067034.1 RELT-like protein 1 [Coregonus clupeaformis]XP_045067035.1 RELT-like protein 1 [Coregonus clupeaformis]XP_045067036.1 RELT-like protein 1 [Coregonus clupeaformis]
MASSAVTGVVPPGQTVGGGSSSGVDEQVKPEYIAFVLVPVFFLLGLLGVLICHVLKRKGYRCTTEAEDEEEAARAAEEEKKDLEMCAELNDTYVEGNDDTVGQIVQYIMENEANSDALKAMVPETSIDSDGPPLTPTSPTSPSSPPVTPISPGAPAGAAKHTCNHLHTIGGMGGHRNICNRCNHKKWPLMRHVSAKRIADRRSHGEVTVLAVGRFRVTKCDKERPARERRTLLITDSNGSMPTTPTEKEPPERRTTSESQQKDEGDDPK